MHVVIVGGGFAGVKTALGLVNRKGITVQLISQSTNFEYHGALYRTTTGHSPMEVVIPLKDIFVGANNVEIVLDTITELSAEKKRVVGADGSIYTYDELVLGLGLVPNYFGITDMEKHAETMYTVKGAISLRHKLSEAMREASSKPLKVVIIGAGACGVELSGDVQTFASLIADKYAVKPRRIEVTLIDGAARVLPSLLPKASEKATARLKQLGVKLVLNAKVEACEADKVCLNISNLAADIIVWTAGSSNNPFFEHHSRIFKLDEKRKKVIVDDYFQAAEHIYVLGDNAATQYSGMAQTALDNGLFMSQHLLRIHNKSTLKKYHPKEPIYVVPIGHHWAVLQQGNSIRSGVYGWLVRRRADLAIFEAFEPFETAVRTWRKGNRLADF